MFIQGLKNFTNPEIKLTQNFSKFIPYDDNIHNNINNILKLKNNIELNQIKNILNIIFIS